MNLDLVIVVAYGQLFSKKILVAKKIAVNFPEKYKSKVYQVGSILDKNIINYSVSKKNDNKW